MSLLPRLRLALARHPWAYWAIAGLGALTAALAVHGVEASAQRAAAAWGATRPVLVVTHDVAAGDAVTLEARHYPTAMVPAAALDQRPEGPAIAARALAAGAVVAPGDLLGAGAVPHDWVVFAVAGDDVPHMSPGNGAALYSGGQEVCAGLVTGTGDATVEVAVPRSCAGPLSAAVADRAVVVSRLP